MDAIAVTVVFVVVEHGWVKAQLVGVPVEATGRDRAEAEALVIDAVRAHFAESGHRVDARDRAELCLVPADPPWRRPGSH